MEKAKKLILSMIIIFMATPLYAADKAVELATAVLYYPSPAPTPIINHTKCISFCDCINTVKKDTKDNADVLREQWKQALGVDIFYLHFKAKEITHNIEERSRFKLFNMRGKATIKENSATYTFSHKF